MRTWFSVLGFMGLLLAACSAPEKDDALIAVATNFLVTAQDLEADFESRTPYNITLTSGATGQLYAQILQGAPYDIFLSADQARPKKLVADGQAVSGSCFTYALGQIALWAPGRGSVSKDTLNGTYRHLALANPDLAPYGRAGKEALARLGVMPNIVLGQNAGQAHGLVATGNAEMGIVALSSLQDISPREYWVISDKLYAPIAQDAVLLNRASGNEAAKAFLAYLRTPKAAAVVSRHGYLSP